MAFVEVDPLQARMLANDSGGNAYNLLQHIRQDPKCNGTGARICAASYGHASSVNRVEVICVEGMSPVSNIISAYDVRPGYTY